MKELTIKIKFNTLEDMLYLLAEVAEHIGDNAEDVSNLELGLALVIDDGTQAAYGVKYLQEAVHENA